MGTSLINQTDFGPISLLTSVQVWLENPKCSSSKLARETSSIMGSRWLPRSQMHLQELLPTRFPAMLTFSLLTALFLDSIVGGIRHREAGLYRHFVTSFRERHIHATFCQSLPGCPERLPLTSNPMYQPTLGCMKRSKFHALRAC